MYGLSLFAWINDQMAFLLEQWMILYVFQSLAAYIKCSIPRFGEFWRKTVFLLWCCEVVFLSFGSVGHWKLLRCNRMRLV